MTREERYVADMEALGIWREAFWPAVRELAQSERDLQRMRKSWIGRGGGVDDRLCPLIVQARQNIQVLREHLGLTPKSLHRRRPEFFDEAPSVLETLRRKHGGEA